MMLKAGTSSVDITPPVGTVLGGNCSNDNRSRGIRDRLMANILTLNDGDRTVIVIGMDLIGINRKDSDNIKNKIWEISGIPQEDIMIFATHTHSGPNNLKIFEYNYTAEEFDEIDDYLQKLPGHVARGVGDALACQFECSIGFASGRAEGFSYNRRAILDDGSLKMVFEEFDRSKIVKVDGPESYPVMSVLKVSDNAGAIRSVMINYASHPAIACSAQWLFTRDYIDSMTTTLQERYGSGLVVVYANGSQGNLVAADPRKPFITGFEESDRVGKGLAEAAIGLIEKASPPDDISIDIRTAALYLPMRRVSEKERRRSAEILAKDDHSKLQFHGIDPRTEAHGVIKLADYPYKEMETVLQVLRIGDVFMAALPGEVFIQYGMKIIDGSPFEKTFVIGLANDYIGYIPTPDAFKKGGYEVISSFGNSMFDMSAGDIMVSEVLVMIRQMGSSWKNHS